MVLDYGILCPWIHLPILIVNMRHRSTSESEHSCLGDPRHGILALQLVLVVIRVSGLMTAFIKIPLGTVTFSLQITGITLPLVLLTPEDSYYLWFVQCLFTITLGLCSYLSFHRCFLKLPFRIIDSHSKCML
jgi:hypothetical protein